MVKQWDAIINFKILLKCNIHTKYFTSCNHPEQCFFSLNKSQGKNKEKKNLMMPGKITITSKRIGIFSSWNGSKYTLSLRHMAEAWTPEQNQNSTSKKRRKCELGKRPTVSITKCFRNMNFYCSACCYASLINLGNWEFNEFFIKLPLKSVFFRIPILIWY